MSTPRARAGRHPAWQARAVLGVPGVVTVGFLLGELEVVPREREHELVEHLGPDILGPGWDAAVAARNLGADADRPIGLALLDQRAVAGLGNVYRNELCFLRGVLPTRPVGEVPDLEGLAELAHRLIFANPRPASSGPRPVTFDAVREPGCTAANTGPAGAAAPPSCAARSARPTPPAPLAPLGGRPSSARPANAERQR
ncbi:MAG: hypothetical protein WDM88_11260 [Galbitalea sp.]